MGELGAFARDEERGAGCSIRAMSFVGILVWVAAMALVVVAGRGGTTPEATAAIAPSALSGGSFLYADARQAPPIELTDPDSRPFSLASLRGQEVLVFFGYTHCPDVCPATVGVIGRALANVGSGARAVFVSIDPERDTPAWLKDYIRYIPKGFVAVTGSPQQIRSTADAWGVKYARVDTGSANGYSMSHTADVFLVDAAGRLRGQFPFGTGPDAVADALRTVAASTPQVASASANPPSSAAASARPGAAAAEGPQPTPATPAVPAASSNPTASAIAAASGDIRPEVVSSSVWSGGKSPVILALYDAAGGRLNETATRVSVQLRAPDGTPVGQAVGATAVRPPGVDRISYVATLDIPQPGSWQLSVSALTPAGTRSGSVALTAFDPGASAALGAPAPTAHTPTVDDVGGDPRAVTTDPAPDLRLTQRSTTDVLGAHVPFVLVIDSTRFRVSPVCGKALILARYLVDRWPDVAFIHLEPFVYTLVSETPVLSGDIKNPPLSPVAAAWGIGDAPWGARSMPWVFVVDGNGVVRAKYQGPVGSDDVDVMLALLAGEH